MTLQAPTLARPQPAAASAGRTFAARASAARSSRTAPGLPPPVAWSFADLGVSAPSPTGSTALDTENWEGPVGDNGGAPAEAPVAPAHGAPAQAPAPTISHATVKAAPSGASNARRRIGVAEVVDFTGAVAGTWTASAGTPRTGPSSTTFQWTAPPLAAAVTVALSVGRRSARSAITVVPPRSISMRNVGSHAAQVGAGGACMLTEVTFRPTDVCLGAIQWLEVAGPATSVSGFFKKYTAAQLRHRPNADYALVNDANIMEAGPNNGPNDHCSWHTTPGPYKRGSYTWVIPNRYIVDGEAAASGRRFTTTRQVFTMSAAGMMTITKAGAST